jgi:hypothetical protein
VVRRSSEVAPIGTTLFFAWVEGEMREAMPLLATLADEQARLWAEVDLPLLAGREEDGAWSSA